MSGLILKPLTDQDTPVWTVSIDGQEVPAGTIEIRSRFGILGLGVGPEGYHRILYQEPGFGGSVNVLHFVEDGIPYVGTIDMDRSDTMGESRCCPGMFVHDDKTHHDISLEILTRELGLDAGAYVAELIGVVNPNRSIYHTPAGEGVHYYGVNIPRDQVVEKENGIFVFKDGIAKTPDAGLQRITGLEFRPWHTLAGCQDGFIATALGLLLAHLEANK